MGWWLIPRVLVISYKHQLFDMPDERKVHDKPIPRLGGLTFFPVITITLSLLMGIRYLYGWDVVNIPAIEVLVEFLMLLAGSCILYVVGVGDDLIGVSYKWKFVAQIICGILIAMSGLWMHSLGNFMGVDSLPKWLGYLATIFVVVYITNAFNLIDGIDGLASGLTAIALFAVYLVLLFFFTRFGVIGQLQRISAMESEYSTLQSQVDALKNSNAGYDAVRAEYSHYGNGYLNDDEKAQQDRMKILDVIEDKLLPSDALQDITITQNTATLTINSEKLKNVSEIVADLESDPIVSYVTVTQSTGNAQQASADPKAASDGKNVTSTMTIVFQDADAGSGDTQSPEEALETDAAAEAGTEAAEAGNE